MQELIREAADAAQIAAAKLQTAFTMADDQPIQPCGKSLADKALFRHLQQLLKDARELADRLNKIC